MPINWCPSIALTYRGTEIFHCYKDEYSDIPMEFWYTFNGDELPGSEFEFDIREMKISLQLAQSCPDDETLKLLIDRLINLGS